jgi:type II secretory pathway pseudopilin PulG
MAIAGLVLGYLGIGPMLLILAAIAIPNLLRARIAANEASAVATMRTLNAAETAYAQLHKEAGYTCALSELSGDRLITPALASGQVNGYAFGLRDCAAGVDGGPNVKYHLVAHPLMANQTGVRAFCSDESAVVRVDASGSAQACIENGGSLE